MRITKIEDLHCNAGWRDFSFLKISTDEGLVGWSEFMDVRLDGLAGVIRKLGEQLIGWDPRPVEKITAYLHGVTRQSVGGIAQQAIAAIENALVDLKAKASGIPVYEMLGGPVRDRLQLYWSHCGTWRISHAHRIKEWTGFDPIRSLDDVERAGAEVARARLQGPEDQHLPLRRPGTLCAHARLQRPRLAGAEHQPRPGRWAGGADDGVPRRRGTAVSGCISI